MKKEVQAILLVLVFSIAAASRLSILGWLMIFGVGSVLILGITHFIVHFYSMNYLATSGRMNILKIILSHLLFLGVFLFQFDFDDSRTYSVLSYVYGIEDDFLENNYFPIILISLTGYILLSVFIIIQAKKAKIKGKNTKYILPSVIVSIFLPFIIMSGFYANEVSQQSKEFEDFGEYRSISRALKNPDKVTTLKVNPTMTTFSEFPEEILTLPNLQVIDFNGQKITSIPDDIGKLENLEVLNLIDNNIKEINPSICDCKKLQELRIGGDKIQSFPECLKTMQSLKHLSFQCNTVNELMDELREFQNLETFHFYLKDGVIDRKKLSQIKEETGLEHKY